MDLDRDRDVRDECFDLLDADVLRRAERELAWLPEFEQLAIATVTARFDHYRSVARARGELDDDLHERLSGIERYLLDRFHSLCGRLALVITEWRTYQLFANSYMRTRVERGFDDEDGFRRVRLHSEELERMVEADWCRPYSTLREEMQQAWSRVWAPSPEGDLQ